MSKRRCEEEGCSRALADANPGPNCYVHFNKYLLAKMAVRETVNKTSVKSGSPEWKEYWNRVKDAPVDED